MAETTFKTLTIFSGKCFAYMGALVVIFVVLHFLIADISPIFAIIACGVAGIAVAFIWPRIESCGTLPSEQVDFWYYSISILGVFLLFVANATEREKLSTLAEYQAAEAAIENAENLKGLVNKAFPENKTIHQLIVGFAKQEHRNRKSETKSEPNIDPILHCAPAVLLEPKITLERYPQPTVDRRPEFPNLRDHQILCLPADSAITIRRDIETNKWRLLSKSANLREALSIITTSELDSAISFSGNGISLSLSTIRHLLDDPYGATDRRSLQLAIDTYIKGKIGEKKDKALKYGKLGNEITDYRSITEITRFSAFVWPYMLIGALSMKLARRVYGTKNIPRDTSNPATVPAE